MSERKTAKQFNQQQMEEFVVRWQRAQLIDEAAQFAGITRKQAMIKAAGLRKNGVKLKKFPRQRKQYDYKRLKALAAAEIRKQTIHEGSA